MGQKVNPIGLRVGINRTWDSRWYAKDDYAKLLHEDVRIREYLEKQLEQAGISKIVIERPAKKARVTIYSARPGVIIGKKGADIEKLRAAIAKMTNSEVHLNIVEVRKPEIDAKLVAENIAQQLARRVSYRRAKLCRSFGRCGNCADGMVSRRPRAAPYAARQYRLRDGFVSDDIRDYRCQGLDL